MASSLRVPCIAFLPDSFVLKGRACFLWRSHRCSPQPGCCRFSRHVPQLRAERWPGALSGAGTPRTQPNERGARFTPAACSLLAPGSAHRLNASEAARGSRHRGVRSRAANNGRERRLWEARPSAAPESVYDIIPTLAASYARFSSQRSARSLRAGRAVPPAELWRLARGTCKGLRQP